MADAQDLKSCGELSPCGFESRLGYCFMLEKAALMVDCLQGVRRPWSSLSVNCTFSESVECLFRPHTFPHLPEGTS